MIARFLSYIPPVTVPKYVAEPHRKEKAHNQIGLSDKVEVSEHSKRFSNESNLITGSCTMFTNLLPHKSVSFLRDTDNVCYILDKSKCYIKEKSLMRKIEDNLNKTAVYFGDSASIDAFSRATETKQTVSRNLINRYPITLDYKGDLRQNGRISVIARADNNNTLCKVILNWREIR